MKTHHAWLLALFLAVLLAPTAPLLAQGRETHVVQGAVDVLREITAVPERGIPDSMLRNAQAVAIFPNVIKAGFVIGARHGRGVLCVRDRSGGWSNPIFVLITGGSFGWQVGAQSTDLVLVFRTRRSVDRILEGKGKFTLGADAAIAAGPLGRQTEAGTDVSLRAEIFSYSRSRGLFLGVSLEGASLRVDWESNQLYYEQPGVPPSAIIDGGSVRVRESGQKLKEILARRAPGKPGSGGGGPDGFIGDPSAPPPGGPPNGGLPPNGPPPGGPPQSPPPRDRPSTPPPADDGELQPPSPRR